MAGHHVVLHLAHERGDLLAVEVERHEHLLVRVVTQHDDKRMRVEFQQRRVAPDTVHRGGNAPGAAQPAHSHGTLFRARLSLESDLFVRHVFLCH